MESLSALGNLLSANTLLAVVLFFVPGFAGLKAWVLITRADGTQFGGVVGFATSFPNPQELYIEQLWRVDSEQGFTEAVDGSAGLLVRRDEIETMEFFHYEAD